MEDHLELTTAWTALAPWPRQARPGYLPAQPKYSLALLDGDGYRWVQADVPASIPFQTWQPGERLIDVLSFPIPADMPPGEYGIRLSVYDDEGGPLAMQAGGRTIASPPLAAYARLSARRPAQASGQAPGQAPARRRSPSKNCRRNRHCSARWAAGRTRSSWSPA